MATGIFSKDFIDRVTYSLRLMLTSVDSDMRLSLEVRRRDRQLIVTTESIALCGRKREVTVQDYLKMDALQSSIQDYLDYNFPNTRTTSFDLVLICARLARKCEFRGNRRHVSVIYC